jgi:hypothetical protein
MSMSRNDGFDDGRESDATRELLEEAQTLAVQIERLLASPSCQLCEAEAFRVRLARAHTLSLLDQLSELLGPRQSQRAAEPSVRGPRSEGDNAVSGIRPATSWR